MAADSPAGTCPDCRGRSRTWKGNVHAWRCTRCVEDAIGLDNRPAVYTTNSPELGSTDEHVAAHSRRRNGGMATGLTVPASATRKKGR